jgi:dolichol-phosphate mannosyltransferase
VVAIEYVQLLLDKLIGDLIPPRYILFAMVGSAGVVIHLALLKLLIGQFHIPILPAQTAATVVVMTLNFLLNNSFTYRDLRLRGRRLLAGLLGFYATCSIGLGVNVVVADTIERLGFPWYVVGLAGLVVSSVWNFGVTTTFIWRARRRRARLRGLEALTASRQIYSTAGPQTQ